MASIIDTIYTLYSDDDCHRFTYSNNVGHTKALVDIHGMTCCAAIQYVNNAINIISILSQDTCHLTVIHGYNHGTALQQMIRKDLTNDHIKERILDDSNPGITRLVIS